MPKKAKKGKKKKSEAGPEIRTTQEILNERAKMFCPRLGDSYTRTIKVEHILQDVVYKILEKCVNKEQDFVNLSGMRLSGLPNFLTIDPDLEKLVDINLSRNQLFNSQNVFQSLSQLRKLKRLNLCDNYLNGTLDESISELFRLESLYLDNNQITSFPASIGALTNLKILTASENLITELPYSAKEWTSLTYLNLKHNKLMELPGDLLKSWTKLERLYLTMNKISVLPEEIGFCSRLSELDLSANAIDSLPTSLAMCNQMVILNVAMNKISDIPPDIFSLLVQLRELQLYKNKLTELPPEIGNLKALKRLSLSSNNLKGLPEEIGDCTALRELYINNNAKFSQFPGSAGHLRQLQELSMRKCPALKALPSTTQDMTALRELDVRAAKKQVCKIAPEVADMLKAQKCILRGGVVKKAKGKKK